MDNILYHTLEQCGQQYCNDLAEHPGGGIFSYENTTFSLTLNHSANVERPCLARFGATKLTFPQALVPLDGLTCRSVDLFTELKSHRRVLR